MNPGRVYNIRPGVNRTVSVVRGVTRRERVNSFSRNACGTTISACGGPSRRYVGHVCGGLTSRERVCGGLKRGRVGRVRRVCGGLSRRHVGHVKQICGGWFK